MIKRCLIVDTETTGLEPEKHSCIEVGAILYSVVSQTSLVQFSCIVPILEPDDDIPLLPVVAAPPQLNPMVEVNRISDAALTEMLECYDEEVAAQLDWMADRADIIVAHNAEFDRAFFQKKGFLKHTGQWLCTAEDFEWPKSQSRSKNRLTQIAIAYDVPVVSAHRALDDCRLIAAIFDKQNDLQAMFTQALEPKEIYVSLLPFAQKDLNKANGFVWDQLIPGYWAKKMTFTAAQALPFQVSKAVIVE